MLDLLKRQLILHMKENTFIYLLMIFIFITGIMTGAFTVISLSTQQKVYTGNFLQEFFNSQLSIPINRWTIFRESLWQHFITTFLIWLFGLFIWGAPFILAIIGIRGFSFGFTIGFMVEYYRVGGFLFSLFCVLPQSIIYVPCYIGMGIMALLFSTMSFGKRGVYYTRQQRLNKIGQYTIKVVLAFLAILIGILIETFIAPLMFPLFTWIFR